MAKTVTLDLPFGRDERVSVSIPESACLGSFAPSFPPPEHIGLNEIKRALAHPVAGPRLRDTLKGSNTVAVAIADLTRASPDDLFAWALMDEFEAAGVPDRNVTFFIGTGLHRPMTDAEVKLKLDPALLSRFRVIVHNARKPESLLEFPPEGDSPGFHINREFAEADVKIATGIIEPHQFAGFSGGVKTGVIGLAGPSTIGLTHGFQMLSQPACRTGVVDRNPFREFLNRAAGRVGIGFILNALQDSGKRIVRAFAGEPTQAFAAGVAMARQAFQVRFPEVPDIVLAMVEHPKSLNLYQATRVCNNIILAGEPAVKRGGTVIVAAPCPEGLGEEQFLHWMDGLKTPEDIWNKAEREGYPPGGHKGFILGLYLRTAEVVIAGSKIPAEILKRILMTPAATVQDAVDYALKKAGRKAKIAVLPYGMTSLPVVG